MCCMNVFAYVARSVRYQNEDNRLHLYFRQTIHFEVCYPAAPPFFCGDFLTCDEELKGRKPCEELCSLPNDCRSKGRKFHQVSDTWCSIKVSFKFLSWVGCPILFSEMRLAYSSAVLKLPHYQYDVGFAGRACHQTLQNTRAHILMDTACSEWVFGFVAKK